MNIIEIYEKFPTQEICIEHLEQVRWQGQPKCVYCGSDKTSRQKEKNRQSRWQCSKCKKSFSVTVDTIFHKTHIDLQKWFLLIALMLNAKKSLSACQAARDLGMNRPTVWRMMHRIRKVMDSQSDLLYGIVEMDETYIGGKPRKNNDKNKNDVNDNKRGRGTKKKVVVGMIEREGNVKATSLLDNLKSKSLEKLVRDNIDISKSILMTDEFKGYLSMNKIIKHRVINHQNKYVNGDIHTNVIESFWALLKRGIIGQFHKVSSKYLEKYIDEFCFRFNARFLTQNQLFNMTLDNAVN